MHTKSSSTLFSILLFDVHDNPSHQEWDAALDVPGRCRSWQASTSLSPDTTPARSMPDATTRRDALPMSPLGSNADDAPALRPPRTLDLNLLALARPHERLPHG